ncbi:hypothetical protein Micbo1qcDRAFT_233085 [Microdochium bolleyi]|uniref:Monooxygenase n=1 Tax=Microdochium bolleyi TaxID=196109 RepID=A0A136J3A9_9PEZI|nr:hypothetical protein Micbo1qcDRAFT_233085 [Microdochium bolleyi]
MTIRSAHVNGHGHGHAAPSHASPRTGHLRIAIIGAGASGLIFAYKLRKHLKDHVDFVIYEKNPDLGGTWYENRYPGCACDVPSHVYQFPFAPNPSWSQFYASSTEIHSYFKHVAQHYGLEQFVRYGSEVVSARWADAAATWALEIAGEPGSLEYDVLVNAGGILNNPHQPGIEGYDTFAGPRLHTAAWDAGVDLAGKRVAVIGAGASAVQLLPKIAPLAGHVDVYIRTPSWITPPVAAPPDAKSANHEYSPEEQEGFRWNDSAYLAKRKEMEDHFNGSFAMFRRGSAQQVELRAQLEARMKTLIADPALREMLIPKFEVGCRRINPGEPYLAALQEPTVQPVFEPIERITPRGVVVKRAGGREGEGGSREERPADVIIAATGFNTSFRPRFPIIGRGGVNLQDEWAREPVSYMGTGVAGYPNYLMFLGPNTPIANGSVMGTLDATSDYFIRLLRKMIRQKVVSFDVRRDAQHDFDVHTQEFMKQMVWTGACRSWYKSNETGRISAIWPGSTLHYMQTLAEDRWEDYEWTHSQERFSYWAGGVSWVEDRAADMLGFEARESAETCRTIPRPDSDLSFYLYESTPLPRRRPSGNLDGLVVPV